METKLCSKSAQSVARKLNYEGCIVVEAIGRKGGLMLLWKQEIRLDLWNYLNNMLMLLSLMNHVGLDGYLPAFMVIPRSLKGDLGLIC